MYAGHFAAALAIKAAEPRAPTAAVMGLAFLPDLLWLGLAKAGVEVVDRPAWFDGWSHSVASIVLQAAVVATLWSRCGPRVSAAGAAAVLSHLLLDLPTHPAPLQWYPHAAGGVGNLMHGWAEHALWLGKSNGWWVEALFVVCGLAVYVGRTFRTGHARYVTASVVLAASLQIAFG